MGFITTSRTNSKGNTSWPLIQALISDLRVKREKPSSNRPLTPTPTPSPRAMRGFHFPPLDSHL
jgi:hypothetical protein